MSLNDAFLFLKHFDWKILKKQPKLPKKVKWLKLYKRPTDFYSLSVVLLLHNSLLSKRRTPVNLFTRGCKQVCKCGIHHLCTGFAPQFANFCISFAPSKFGANPFFRPEFVFHKHQNLWFNFDFICFYFILSLFVLTKTNYNSSSHKSTKYTFNSWAKTSSCLCCFRCQLDLGDTKSRL